MLGARYTHSDMDQWGGQEDAPAEGSPLEDWSSAPEDWSSAPASPGVTASDPAAAPFAVHAAPVSASATFAAALAPAPSAPSFMFAAAGAGAAAPTTASAQPGGATQSQRGPGFACVHADPPEGVDWANRWAELEIAMVKLGTEYDKLRDENSQLQRCRRAVASPALSSKPAVDTQRVDALRKKLHEQHRRAAEHFRDKLSEDLHSQADLLEKASRDKIRLHLDKDRLAAELEQVKRERDRLTLEKDDAARVIDDLRAQRAAKLEEQAQLHEDQSSCLRKLTQELEDARADAAFHRAASEEAIAEQRVLMTKAAQAATAQKQSEANAAKDKAGFAKAKELNVEQVKRLEVLRELSNKHVADAQGERLLAKQAEEKALKQCQELGDLVTRLQEKVSSLEREREEAVIQRIPGAEPGASPPGDFPSWLDLVQQWSAATEEARNERREKEELRAMFEQVKLDVRQRFSALQRMRDPQHEEMAQHNEKLCRLLKDMERDKTDAEQQVQQATRSMEFLETHMKDLSTQLAVLLHENTMLKDKLSWPGMGPIYTLRDAQNQYLSIKELADQNKALKLSIAEQIREKEAAEKSHSELMKSELEKQDAEYKKYMEAAGVQIDVLTEVVSETNQKHDEACKALKELQEASAENREKAARVPMLQEQLAREREDFMTREKTKLQEAEALREKTIQLQRDLGAMNGRRDQAVEQRAKVERALEDGRRQLGKAHEKVERCEAALATQEIQTGKVEEQLAQANTDKVHLEILLQGEAARAQEAENQCQKIAAERDDLQTSITRRVALHEEEQLRFDALSREKDNQLKRSEERCEELQKWVRHLSTVKETLEQDILEAKHQISTLESSMAKMEVQITERAAAMEKEKTATHVSQLESKCSELEGELKRVRDEREFEWEALKEQLRAAEQEKARVETADAAQQARAEHEGELCRLSAEKAGVEEALQESRRVHEARVKELELALRRQTQERAELVAEVDAWKRTDHLFVSVDMQELQALRSKQQEWQDARANSTKEIERLQTDVKAMAEKMQNFEQMKAELDEHRITLADEVSKRKQAKQNEEAAVAAYKKAQGLRALRDRRIAELEAGMKGKDDQSRKSPELEAMRQERDKYKKELEELKSKHHDLQDARANATKQIERFQAELKDRDQKLQKSGHVQAEISELREKVADEAVKRKQAEQSAQSESRECKRVQALMALRDRKIQELEKKVADLEAEFRRASKLEALKQTHYQAKKDSEEAQVKAKAEESRKKVQEATGTAGTSAANIARAAGAATAGVGQSLGGVAAAASAAAAAAAAAAGTTTLPATSALPVNPLASKPDTAPGGLPASVGSARLLRIASSAVASAPAGDGGGSGSGACERPAKVARANIPAGDGPATSTQFITPAAADMVGEPATVPTPKKAPAIRQPPQAERLPQSAMAGSAAGRPAAPSLARLSSGSSALLPLAASAGGSAEGGEPSAGSTGSGGAIASGGAKRGVAPAPAVGSSGEGVPGSSSGLSDPSAGSAGGGAGAAAGSAGGGAGGCSGDDAVIILDDFDEADEPAEAAGASTASTPFLARPP